MLNKNDLRTPTQPISRPRRISISEITTHTSQAQNNPNSRAFWSNLFSTKGRIGRFTYFFYSLVLPLLLFWVFAAIAGLLAKMGHTGELIAYAVLFLAFLLSVFSIFQLAIKRCHDFNASGWFSLLTLVPFAILLFCLIPGNPNDNQYGEPPESPSTLLKTGSLLLIATLVAVATNWLLTALFG